jgi:hypothetical protein
MKKGRLIKIRMLESLLLKSLCSCGARASHCDFFMVIH